VLSKLLHKQESLGSLKGIKIARNCPVITHLLFADDLFIFAKATSSEARAIKSCLDSYCNWSRQAINNSKSSILFNSNIDTSTINNIKGIILFRPTSSAPYYLGLPLFFGKSKKEVVQPILDKVMGKIEGWRAKTLSQARRTVLIKSTAASIPLYSMSTFILPDSTCNSLDKLFKKKKKLVGFPQRKDKKSHSQSLEFNVHSSESRRVGFP
jgi:hypothetical protein